MTAMGRVFVQHRMEWVKEGSVIPKLQFRKPRI